MADRDITDTMMDAMVYAVAFAVAVVGLSPVFRWILANTPAAQYYQSLKYTGLTDERRLQATPALQWLNLVSGPPHVGWISASFNNDGPNSVFIGINNPDELHELAFNEGYDADFAGAERRIEYVFYKCWPGEKALVRVIGKY